VSTTRICTALIKNAIVLVLALPRAAGAQADTRADTRALADSLVSAGDVAARDSKPREAIDAYERAIVVDTSRRLALLSRLGKQYLWSDSPRQAARLFTDYLAAHPQSCDARLDLALALSWANALDSARVIYDDVAARCVYERGDARLGAARVLRWGNNFS
jgi:tetratricopeptide (TPR) repeat protein